MARRKQSEPTRQRLRDRGLTLPQANAVELLAGGKNDTQTAEALGVTRETVTRWRCYDPVFIAALNRQRNAIWQHGTDKLRTLYGKALDTLASTMDDASNPDRWKAALHVLKLLQITQEDLEIGPAEPEHIVRNVTDHRREKMRSRTRSVTLDELDGLPPFETDCEKTWNEMERNAGVADSET